MNNSTISNSTSTESDSMKNVISIIHFIFISFVILHFIYFIYMLIKINLCSNRQVPEEEAKMRKINEECSICIDKIINETQLLCSHSFCGKCIYDYYSKNFLGSQIRCPICRKDSKLFVTNFDRTDDNKEIYQSLINYNESMTNNYSTSLCLCYNIINFFVFHSRNILNFRNIQYRNQRRCLAIFLILLIIIIIIPINGNGEIIELIEDIIYYMILIFIIAESFYRRIRAQIEFSNQERLEQQSQTSNNNGNNNIIDNLNNIFSNNLNSNQV